MQRATCTTLPITKYSCTTPVERSPSAHPTLAHGEVKVGLDRHSLVVQRLVSRRGLLRHIRDGCTLRWTDLVPVLAWPLGPSLLLLLLRRLLLLNGVLDVSQRVMGILLDGRLARWLGLAARFPLPHP